MKKLSKKKISLLIFFVILLFLSPRIIQLVKYRSFINQFPANYFTDFKVESLDLKFDSQKGQRIDLGYVRFRLVGDELNIQQAGRNSATVNIKLGRGGSELSLMMPGNLDDYKFDKGTDRQLKERGMRADPSSLIAQVMDTTPKSTWDLLFWPMEEIEFHFVNLRIKEMRMKSTKRIYRTSSRSNWDFYIEEMKERPYLGNSQRRNYTVQVTDFKTGIGQGILINTKTEKEFMEIMGSIMGSIEYSVDSIPEEEELVSLIVGASPWVEGEE